MGWLAYTLVTFITFSLVFRYFVLPFLLRTLTKFRVSALSFLSFKGLEFRSKEDAAAVVPTFRAERGRWAWGGLKGDEVGLLVVKIEGVSVRIRSRHNDKIIITEEISSAKRQSGFFSTQGGKVSLWILHLLIHHYPSLARIISIQISGLRVIFDDLDGLEVSLDTVACGLKVDFRGVAEAAPGCAPSSPDVGPTSIFQREHPLCASPTMDNAGTFSSPSSPTLSPTASPISPSTPSVHPFSPFSFPASSPNVSPTKRGRQVSRLTTARRQASVLQTRMSSTASSVWTRVIGRAHGSVSISASFHNVKVMQPQAEIRRSMSTKSSTHDLNDDTHKILLRPSNSSLRSDAKEVQPSVSARTSRTFQPLFRPSPKRNRTFDYGSYDTLMGLEGQSRIGLGLGFGPKKGLLGEDTLGVTVQLGRLRAEVSAVEKLNRAISKAAEERKARSSPFAPRRKPLASRWGPYDLPRIIMRAFETVQVSFSEVSISHHLPTASSPQHSRYSSSSSISSLAEKDNMFAVGLDLVDVSCTLSAADSSNNERARNAFGTNPNPASKVRGIGFQLQWRSIDVSCIAPGESINDKTQLLTIRQADFNAFSSWRPAGWTREELLFASDPNLALIVGRGEIASVDCMGDLQLLHDLKAALDLSRHQSHSTALPQAAQSPKSCGWLPPRVRMVLDIGHIMGVVADRVTDHETTLTFSSDGIHASCFTGFSDLIGRRRDRSISKQAFKDEEELRANRAADEHGDYALPQSMLKPELRRKFRHNPAKLQDDLSISMKADAQVSMEPISVHMTLSGDTVRDQRSYHFASIGRTHGTMTGDVLGRVELRDDGSESASLDPSSLSCGIDIGVDQGIKVDLWRPEVIEAIILMGKARQHATPREPKLPPNTGGILSRLPSGLSARLSLGLINILVGHAETNPDGTQGLIKGIWLQTSALFEYALYKHRAQTLPWRHALSAPSRAKLRLPEDITTQALAFSTRYQPEQGCAALVSLNFEDTCIKPIFNTLRFVGHGGTSQKMDTKDIPRARLGDKFVGWNFQKPRQKGSPDNGIFANNVSPLEISDTDQAQRPWLRIRHARVHSTTQKTTAESHTEHKITSRLDHVAFVSDMSHVYTNLLIFTTITRIAKAWKRPVIHQEPRKAIDLSIDILAPYVTAHIALPLKEQIYIYAGGLGVAKPPFSGPTISADQILLYPPSPRLIGCWEELGKVKKFSMRMSNPGEPLAISAHAEAVRVRIPFSYQLSKLILNITAAAKAAKLLVYNMKNDASETVRRPQAEAPKTIPNIDVSFAYMSLEMKDDPIETSINLIWRAGLVEQMKRNSLEDQFAKKLALINDPYYMPEAEDLRTEDGRRVPVLTKKSTVSAQKAREGLDMFLAQSWVRRIRAAKHEQRRREALALKPMQALGPEVKLPIEVIPSSQTAPLFRASFRKVSLRLADPGLDRKEIIDYMGNISAPFEEHAEFSLMVPLQVELSAAEGKCTLRDYPLPLIRIQPADNMRSPGEPIPSLHMETTLIIAEELCGEDSTMYIPVEIIPAGCGSQDAASYTVQVAKTISPVKTYAQPKFTIASSKTTEFTWGNSYQPAISDFTRVIETLSQPPRDPSPKIGFWDKFRLVLHWQVEVAFAGPCHLHLKGSNDPYAISGLGAGFALVWRGDTRLLINHQNQNRELIQILSDELIIAIPDLTSLNDGAATGGSKDSDSTDSQDESSQTKGNGNGHGDPNRLLIERRYTKPCARFINGVCVGFGFRFERTCRPHTCTNDCGDTEDLFHRQCRDFTFLHHQQVILRSPQAIRRDEQRLGRAIDSYEGFRSDYIHFSVSVVAPTKAIEPTRVENEESHMVNSMHFTPKASHHFLKWWSLFDHKTSLPIRQGRLFPNSPPPSRKFSKHIGTMKYRFHLQPLYLSHMYSQVSKELWEQGKAEALGIKARFGRFKADLHQRLQKQLHKDKQLAEPTVVYHKTIYAVDLLADDLQLKGIRAYFVERPRMDQESGYTEGEDGMPPRASDLPKDIRAWYNYFDYIDADRKPFDWNPTIEIVNLGDCPHCFCTKRVKARASTARDGSSASVSTVSRSGVESSKFGHEPTHLCYLGAAEGVREMQKVITQGRLDELQDRLANYPPPTTRIEQGERQITINRIQVLKRHLVDLDSEETRHINDDTLDLTENSHSSNGHGSNSNTPDFEHTLHVHNPRLYLNNVSRNVLYKYLYAIQDRRQAEYFTSHKSLMTIRETIATRTRRRLVDTSEVKEEEESDIPVPLRMLNGLVDWLTDKSDRSQTHSHNSRFRVIDPEAEDDLRRASRGLAPTCDIKPRLQVLVLKPQIAFRSDAGPNAIVLLAVEEISFKQFHVSDNEASDSVTQDVLARYYGLLKGVQAFYPTADALLRERAGGLPRGLDFIPLEIFLDVRSEATDYDRIVLKSDVSLAFDKFNNIRLLQGLDWPQDAVDEYGEPIKHLRIHQDLTTVIAPRLTLSATSTHYSALSTVVTDLLMYQDPEHKHRSEAVDDFGRQFDTSDRNPKRLLIDLFTLQQSIRMLSDLHRGYESNFERLDEEGKDELFKIRADLQEAHESLYIINATIRATQAKEDARAELKTSSRMDIRIGGVAWHMLKDDLTPLAKLDIDGVVFALKSNKNGTMDSALVIGELGALNSNPDALFPEIVVRDEAGGKRKSKKPFVSVYWSTSPSIGGISIFKIVDIEFVNIRFKLEEKVGHYVVRYIFSDREKSNTTATITNGNGNGNGNGSGNGSLTPTSSLFREREGTPQSMTLASQSHENLSATLNQRQGLYPLARSKSQISINSHHTFNSNTTAADMVEAARSLLIQRSQDAQEMRLRASKNKMFGKVRLHGMGFNLSYKSDDSRKHSTFSMPDCVDFRFKTPEMEYDDKVWPIEEIFEHVKRDVRSFAWSQSGDIISQIIKKTSLFRSKKQLKQLTNPPPHPHSHANSTAPISPSKLRNAEGPSTSTSSSPITAVGAKALDSLTKALSSEQNPKTNSRDRERERLNSRDFAVGDGNPLTMAMSKSHSSSAHGHPLDPSTISSGNGSGSGSGSIRGYSFASNGNGNTSPHGREEDSSEDEEKSKTGGRIKGLFDKLRHKNVLHRDKNKEDSVEEELSRIDSRAESTKANSLGRRRRKGSLIPSSPSST